MNDHEKYMRLAIEAAKSAEQKGAIPIAAIMVKDGEVIATGISTTWVDNDPSAHGEINCIRSACKSLKVNDLTGCTMYGTLEPCGMCVSCSAWANLPELYFGAYREDVAGNEYEIQNWSAEEVAPNMQLTNGGSMKVQGGILREECAALLANYKNWTKQ